MVYYRSTFTVAVVIATLIFVGNLRSAKSADDAVVWKMIGPSFEAAYDQRWQVRDLPDGAKPRSFKFSAIRFHLGYYELRLVNIADFARSKASLIARDQKIDQEFPALFELGVASVFRINPFDSPVVAVAPAGFPTSNREPTNLGLLKIGGVEKSKLLEKGPSAILCLDNAPLSNFAYQVPTFYRTSNVNQRTLTGKCKDAVQIGPRIIEDPGSTKAKEFEADADKYRVQSYPRRYRGRNVTEPVFLGIPTKLARFPPYLRAVLAVDDPGRYNEKGSNFREVARNAYLIVTTSPANLWDLQDLLSSKEFYANEEYAPHWAVNLPGDEYASMIYSNGTDQPVTVGAVAQRQASVLVVTRRR
jgi:hypothetical protein